MPMKPGKDETRDDFVGRCVSEMMDKHPDWENDQAVAACFSMYSEAKKSAGPFDPHSRNLLHLRQQLPDVAVDQWCRAANAAYAENEDHNEAVKAAWEVLRKDGWQRPKNGTGRWSKKKAERIEDDIVCRIMKVDDEQRMVYGWGSVISERGIPVIDSQGDIIESDELLKATTEFMKDARVAKEMHAGEQMGEVVHSYPIIVEIMKGLGIKSDKEGWIVGVYVRDDAVWQRVKSGELRAFSIGGKAIPEAA
jgi:hypothetical protein